jgi:hypothetical protein
LVPDPRPDLARVLQERAEPLPLPSPETVMIPNRPLNLAPSSVSARPLRVWPIARPPRLLPIARSPRLWRGLPVLACVILGLTGCGSSTPRAVDALPLDAQPQTRMLAEVKDDLDALEHGAVAPNALMAHPAPMVANLTGRGFSQVAGQPGHTLNEKRLLAIKAARLEALRDLTEQVHGIRISADSLLRDAVLRNDTLTAHVDGALRGARTVAIEPRGDDGYAVTMELDADTVAYVLRVVGSGA